MTDINGDIAVVTYTSPCSASVAATVNGATCTGIYTSNAPGCGLTTSVSTSGAAREKSVHVLTAIGVVSVVILGI